MKTTRAMILGAVLGVAAYGCGDDDATILECTGTCSCDPDTRTCACSGGSQCVVESASDITLVCEGNADCNLECGVNCRTECPGTSSCTVLMGDDSEAVCNGSGSCDIECDGDCVVDCPGSESCIVRCPVDATCSLTSCEMTDCGDNIYVCRTSCPPGSG